MHSSPHNISLSKLHWLCTSKVCETKRRASAMSKRNIFAQLIGISYESRVAWHFFYQVSKQCLAFIVGQGDIPSNRGHKSMIFNQILFFNHSSLQNVLFTFTQLQLTLTYTRYQRRFFGLFQRQLSSSFKLNENMDWLFISPIYTLLKNKF